MSQTLEEFSQWTPDPPVLEHKTSHSVTLSWSAGPHKQLSGLVYVLQRREKIPPWVTVYSGGRTHHLFDNLAPLHPHRFRLRLALTPRAKADVEEKVEGGREERDRSKAVFSQWSEETWVNTDSAGATAACFSVAVRCGAREQVQQMLAARPGLLDLVHAGTGLAPLATAVVSGNLAMVQLLLSMGADVQHTGPAGRTPLHLALLNARCDIAELLLDHGADLKARDVCGLSAEHLAVDSGDVLAVRFALDRGNTDVADEHGWTPLFRAVCQGASTELIEELVRRGSRVELTDRAGLSLLSAARLLKDGQGDRQRRRHSVLRQVDAQFQHEKALASFTRLTKKISTVHALRSHK